MKLRLLLIPEEEEEEEDGKKDLKRIDCSIPYKLKLALWKESWI